MTTLAATAGDEDDAEGALARRVFTQSVTLTAKKMLENDTSTVADNAWSAAPDRVPLLIGLFCVVTFVVFVSVAIAAYWCCAMPRKDRKDYCSQKADSCVQTQHQNGQVIYPSHSAVFADPKSGQLVYSSRIVPCSERQYWYYSQHHHHHHQHPQHHHSQHGHHDYAPQQVVPRSCSHPGQASSTGASPRKIRPTSQPIRINPKDLMVDPEVGKAKVPQISEFSPHSLQYSSSSVLDDFGTRDDADADGSNMKTRSLPAWVRNKQRPLSTEDDLSDLYAKVNFSKKRKNRMRNDEAAIIALSKSRSQFLHKDTDSLVDNEAVVVYDERTAL